MLGLHSNRRTILDRLPGWLALIGCGTLLAIFVGAIAASIGRTFPLVVAGAVAVLLVLDGLRHWRNRQLVRSFRIKYRAAGKDLLLVYSSSPHWQPYIETHWLPRWGDRAVVFNRSLPWDSEQIEAVIWRRFAGRNDHTPVAIVLPDRGRPQVIRFWRAFRDFKHGKSAALRASEAELESALRGSHRSQRQA